MKIKLPQTSLKLGSTQVLRHSALTKTNIKETRLSSIQTHINLITHKTPIQPKEIKFIGKINKKKIITLAFKSSEVSKEIKNSQSSREKFHKT